MYKYFVFCFVLFISTSLLSNPNQEKSPMELWSEYSELIIGDWVDSNEELYKIISFDECKLRISGDYEQNGKYFVSLNCLESVSQEKEYVEIPIYDDEGNETGEFEYQEVENIPESAYSNTVKLVTIYDDFGNLFMNCEEIISLTKDKLVLKDAAGNISTYKKRKSD
jgi:hypothetical protein